MRRYSVLSGCLLCVLVVACGRPFYEFDLKLNKAVLATESQEIRMRKGSDRYFKIIERPRLEHNLLAPLYVHGHDTRYEIAICLFPYSDPRQPNFFVATSEENADTPIVVIQEAYYHLNDTAAKPLLLKELGFNYGHNPNLKVRVFHLTLPAELIAHQIERSGDGLRDVDRYREKLEGEVYRIVIAALVDGESYTVDMTVRFRIDERYPWGIGIH